MNAQSGTQYFVSTFGDNTNPGTREAPFSTLQEALDVVKKTEDQLKGDVYIFLRGGTYPVTEPIIIDPGRDGGEDHRIIVRPYKNETPILSGGVPVSKWVYHENGIWKAPAEGMNFRQLYVNNKRAVRSRQPNVGDYYRLKSYDLAGERIVLSSNLVARWNHFQEVEMVVQQTWAESYLRLKSYSLHGTVGGVDAYIILQDTEREILFPRPYPKKENNQVFHFENAYEFIDQPGEWYLDRSAGMLYYKPRANEDMESIQVVAPCTETLLQLQGTPDQAVRNVVFEGITFAHSSWTYPNEQGYLNMQGGQYNIRADSLNNQYVGRPPAAVSLRNARNVTLHRNIFRHLGATAIDLFYGTNHCQVNGNVIHDIAGNGITIGKFTQNEETESHVPYNPENPQEVCRNDVVSNNLIVRTGRDYYGTHAIAAGYPAELTIAHNEIRYILYSGISVGYGWTMEPNAMKNISILNNRISNVMTKLDDGAAIYMLSRQPGTLISGNHIHSITPSDWVKKGMAAGIYLDEGTTGTDENPFVLKNNFIEASGFRRYNFHAIGQVVIDHDYNYLHQPGAANVKAHAGLEPEYDDLEKVLTRDESKPLKTKDIVMMTVLRDEKEAIDKYEYYHSKEGVWPEVVHAAQSSGIREIKIYRSENRLVMIITLPENLSEELMNRKYAGSSNRMNAWDTLMKSFFWTSPTTDEKASWKSMKLIHDYKNGVVK